MYISYYGLPVYVYFVLRFTCLCTFHTRVYLLVGLTVMDNSWFRTRIVLEVVVCAGCLNPENSTVLGLQDIQGVIRYFKKTMNVMVTHLSEDDPLEQS